MKKVAPVIMLLFAVTTGGFALFGDESYTKLMALRRSFEHQKLQNTELDLRVSELRNEIHGLTRDPRSLEKAARNELGMSHEGELIFVFEDNAE